MSHLVPCPHCSRHVRHNEASCPFCSGVLAFGDLAPPALPRTRLGRAATFAFGATLAGATSLVACGGESEGRKQGEGGTDSTGGTQSPGGKASAGNGTSAGNTGVGGNIAPPYGIPPLGGDTSQGGVASFGGGLVYGAPPSGASGVAGGQGGEGGENEGGSGGSIAIYGASPPQD